MAELYKTAALVVRWARPLYGDGKAGSYLDHLDLASADGLWRACYRVCPWYEEVILNRKYLIRWWTEGWLSVDGNDQVIVLGAGLAPLSLEILESFPLSHIVELDVTGMPEKDRLYHDIIPDGAHRIAFLEQDVCSDDLIENIGSRTPWFDAKRPKLFIIEGVSYYLPRDRLMRIVATIASQGPSTVIMEYLVPEADVEERGRQIPNGVFNAIADDMGHTPLTRLSKTDISAIVQETGGTVKADVSMRVMERLRTGRCHHFETDESGWIRCAIIEY